MANLPENTSYQSGINPKPSISGFSDLAKNIQTFQKKTIDTPQQPSPPVDTQQSQFNIASRFNQNIMDSMFAPTQRQPMTEQVPAAPSAYYPTGEPIATPETRYSHIPDYARFKESAKHWQAPTEQAVGANWPGKWGGGQYTVDPSQPGELIKSERVYVTPEIRKELLGRRPSSMFQIDHIVPVWAGGADTIENLNVLDNQTHNNKTAIQSVPLTLLTAGKITLNQARFMALTWKDKDVGDLYSQVNSEGYVPLTVAEQYVQKWDEDRKKIQTSKYFKESFVEEMGEFGRGWLPTPVREFAKGLVGGGTSGIVPGTEASEDTGLVGQASNFVGNLTGMLTGIGILGKVMGKVGAFGKVTKAITFPFWKYEGIGAGLGKSKAAQTFAKKTTESLAKKAQTEVLKTTAGLKTIDNVINSATKSLGVDFGNIKGVSHFMETAGKGIKDSMLLLGTYGQLGLLGRELVSEEEIELENHVKQATIDMMFGGLLGGVGGLASGSHSLTGYTTVGGGTMMISLMGGGLMGQTPTMGEAFKEGVLMAALHGMGHQKSKRIQGLNMEQKYNVEATKQATTVLNTYAPNSFPVYKTGAKIPEVLNYSPTRLNQIEQTRQAILKQNPNDVFFKQLGPINTTVKATSFGELIARRELSNIVAKAEKANEIIPNNVIKSEIYTIVTACNFLKNKTLPVKQQQILNAKDFKSLGQFMLPQLKDEHLRFLERTETKLNELPTKIISREATPLKFIEDYKKTTPIKDGGTTVRGLGRNPKTEKPIDPVMNKQANYYCKNPDLFDGRSYILPPSKQSLKIGEWINREQIMAGKEAPITNPENIANVYVHQIKGLETRKQVGITQQSPFLQVGKLPQEKAFDLNNKNHVNKPFDRMMQRFRSYVKQPENVETISKYFNNDIAFKGSQIQPKNAQKLFDMRSKISTMSDEQLLKIIDAPNALNKLTISDAIVIPKMKELGLDIFVGEIKSSTPIGKGENPNDPNIILSVTNKDFSRSMAIQAQMPRITPPPVPATSTILPKVLPKTPKAIFETLTKIQENISKQPEIIKPKIIYSDQSIKSSYKDREVAAQADHKKNKILLNKKEIKKTFDNKAWTKPKIKGVKALPEKQFKNIKDWEDFLIKHEKAHFLPEIKDIKNLALRENMASQQALFLIKKNHKISDKKIQKEIKLPIVVKEAIRTTEIQQKELKTTNKEKEIENKIEEETNAKGETISDNDNLLAFNTAFKDPINFKDIRSETDGVNKAAIKTVEKKLKIVDIDSKEGQELIKFRDSFTKPKIIQGAKNIYFESKMNQEKGAKLFTERISKAFKNKGLEDPTQGYENSQAFKKVFLDSVFRKPFKTFSTISNDGQCVIKVSDTKRPKSFMEQTIGNEIIYFEENKSFKKPDGKQKESFLLEQGYVPFYYDNKPGSLMGIKYDSKMARGKKMSEKGALNDFTNSLFKKIGFKENQDNINSVAKRLKTLNSRELINPIKGEIWNTYVIKDSSPFNRTIKETTPNWDSIKVSDVVSNKQKTKDKIGEGKSIDGTEYSSSENIERMAYEAGFVHRPYHLKPTQTFIDPKTKNLFHQKMELRAWNKQEKLAFEKELGIKLKSTDVVSFEGNVKIGYGKVGVDKGNYWIVETPSESLYFKYNDPHKIGGSVSHGSILSKIPYEANLNKLIKNHYKETADNLKKLSVELQGAKNSYDIEKIWRQHPEFYKDKWMENLYGELKKSAEHGAGVSQFGPTINKEINKLITDYYFKGKFMRGDVLHLKPDTGVKTAKNGEKVNLNSGEQAINKEVFINLYGKNAYKEYLNGKVFYISSWRYPTLKETSITKTKIFVEKKQKLGKSQATSNSADTMKYDNDTDGDTNHYFKIKGKDGIPEPVMDYFETIAKKGEMIFPSLEKTPKILFDGKDTYKKFVKYSEQNLAGGEVIGIAASSARPMRFLVSNKYKAKVGPINSIGKRLISHELNGEIISEKVIKMKKDGITPNDSFVIEPKFTNKESYLLGRMGQEAVDSVGSTNLFKRLENYNGDASVYIKDHLFTNMFGNPSLAGSVNKFISQFQTPYKLGSGVDAIKILQPYIKTLKEIQQSGGKMGPIEEITLNLDGLKKIDFAYTDPVTQKGKELAAIKNILSEFKSEIDIIVKKPTNIFNKWVDITKQVKKKYPNARESKPVLLNEWNKFKKEQHVTKKDKESIAIFSAISPHSNLAWGQYTVRPTFIINESPKVAKTYFEGESQYQKIINSIKPKLPVTSQYTAKDQIKSDKVTITMPMNFKDGDAGLFMRKEFQGKTTMDLIKSGDRTATSRSPRAQKGIKEGDIINFVDKKGNNVIVEAITGEYNLDTISSSVWSKLEGWNTNAYQKLKNNNYKQFQFKLIKPMQKQNIEHPSTRWNNLNAWKTNKIFDFAKEQNWKHTNLKKSVDRFIKDEYEITIWDTKKQGYTIGTQHLNSKFKFLKNATPEDVIETLLDPDFLNKMKKTTTL